jgi:hypothetical protein
MPKWLRVLLLVVGVGVGTCGLLVSAGMWWFNRNKEALKTKYAEATAAGGAFGREHDDTECVDEALARKDAKGGVLNQVASQVFLQACLKVAPRTPGFCDGVPPPGAKFIESTTWASAACGRRGLGELQACSQMMQEIQRACASASTGTPPKPSMP